MKDFIIQNYFEHKGFFEFICKLIDNMSNLIDSNAYKIFRTKKRTELTLEKIKNYTNFPLNKFDKKNYYIKNFVIALLSLENNYYLKVGLYQEPSRFLMTFLGSLYGHIRLANNNNLSKLDKEYKSPSYSKKNIIYDFNFLKAAECRINDKNLKSGEVNKNSAIIKQTRDEIREEFEIKTKNKNLVNENLLFLNLKKLLNKKQILRNFRPSFLKGLELDFYFETKNKKIAIEYQGIQHYKPIKYFGGKKAYNNQREKDLLKSQLCKKNKIHLIEFPYTLQNNLSNLSMLLNINGITKN